MKLSNHSKGRGNERLGLDTKSFEKLATKALEQGIKHSDTTGSLNRFITSLFMNGHKANNIRIYGEFVYLFCNELLITVINLPNQYKAAVKAIKLSNNK